MKAYGLILFFTPKRIRKYEPKWDWEAALTQGGTGAEFKGFVGDVAGLRCPMGRPCLLRLFAELSVSVAADNLI
jgi:hypothetical protein